MYICISMYIYIHIRERERERLRSLPRGWSPWDGGGSATGAGAFASERHNIIYLFFVCFCDSELSLPYPVARCLL